MHYEIKAKEALKLKKGDTYTTYPSGGGGWGDPLERDPELVRMDTRNEIVSQESAYNDYGVVLEGEAFTINHTETNRVREERKGGKNG